MRRRGVGRVGRPSLVGTAAHTAVVVGTASAVSGSMTQRQSTRAPGAAPAQAFAAEPAVVEAPTAGLSGEAFAQLKQLAELKEAGILTEEEFASRKAKILA